MSVLYEQALLLTYFSVAALLCIVAWDLHAKRRERFLAVRQKALDEAVDALASVEDIAANAVDETLNEPDSAIRTIKLTDQRSRAYYYGRAKHIVCSIPLDRL